MFQQNIEKAPKLFELQRFTIKYPYPEPVLNRVKQRKEKAIK